MKFRKLLLILLISLLVASISFFTNKKKNIIEYKYVYFYINQDNIKNVPSARIRFKVYDIYSYLLDMKEYYNTNSQKKEYFLIRTFGATTPKYLKVGVLSYSKDSLFVKIHCEYTIEGQPFYYNESRWVPYFCLHDTLPTGKKERVRL